MYTGIRIGELLALTWQDVDFKNEMLFIRHTQSIIKKDQKNILTLTEPKSKSSKRIIPLSPFLLQFLKKMKEKSSSIYIISTKRNQMVSIRNYQRLFQNLLCHCHLPLYSFHSLRHTFATRAIEWGMDVKTLSEILGHANASMTLNRYVHSVFVHKRKQMNQMTKSLI